MVIVPSLAPKQVMLVLAIVAERTAGLVIISAPLMVITQAALAASRILTSYVPGARLVKLPRPTHVVPPLMVYS